MKQKGFSLIEMIIAIALLTFGIISVYGAFASTAASTFNASARFTASYLAQDGLEIIRNIRDNNFINHANNPSNPNFTWDAGLRGGPCNVGCMVDYKTKTYTSGPGDTGFLPYSDNTFLGLDQDGFYSYDLGGSPTIFKRKITISEVSGVSNVLHVEALVTWSYKGQLFDFKSSEDLYNWY